MRLAVPPPEHTGGAAGAAPSVSPAGVKTRQWVFIPLTTTREHQLLSSSEPQETDIPSDGMTQIGSQSLSAAGLRAENWKVLSLLHPIPPLNTGEADSSPTSDQT